MAKQDKVKVGEKEYVLQHPGTRWYIKHNDACTGRNGLITEKYFEGLLKHVVIDPQVTFDDFDDCMGDLEELISKIEVFLRGK